jgi:hypothetical protein
LDGLTDEAFPACVGCEELEERMSGFGFVPLQAHVMAMQMSNKRFIAPSLPWRAGVRSIRE